MFKISRLINVLKSLDKAVPVYIAGHTSPDQDSINSCLSLKYLLEDMGLDAYVLLSSSDKNILSWQEHVEEVSNAVTHENYVFIALDLNDTKRLGEFENAYRHAKLTINIDHHNNNTTNANYVFSSSTSSSTCEIIYNLICHSNKNLIDTRLASYIYAGIMTDTNCFSRRITSKTLKIVANLINKNIDYAYINRSTLWKRTKDEIIATGKLAEEIKEKNNFKYVIVDKTLPLFSNISLNDLTKKVAEDLRRLNDLDIFVMLINFGDKITSKVMTFTLPIADKIATLFGGGGHKKEAGFTTNLDENTILKQIEEFLNKNL